MNDPFIRTWYYHQENQEREDMQQKEQIVYYLLNAQTNFQRMKKINLEQLSEGMSDPIFLFSLVPSHIMNPNLYSKSSFKSWPGGSACFDDYEGCLREWGYGARAWTDDAAETMMDWNQEREAVGEKCFWYIHHFIYMDQPAYVHRMYFWMLSAISRGLWSLSPTIGTL